MAVTDSELQVLVNQPSESLDVELKDWLDLDLPINRAKLARHLCALANHGGGHLIFGIADDQKHSSASSFEGQYSNDTISAIVKKYLSPSFQCAVTSVTSNVGTKHVAVRVPSHGTSPVCAIANGPHGKDGRPEGISLGTHYIRMPGPESAPLVDRQLWEQVIQRCVLSKKDELLKNFASIISSGSVNEPRAPLDFLNAWHGAANDAYSHARIRGKTAPWPVELLNNRCHFSYQLREIDAELIGLGQIIPLMHNANRRVKTFVNSGWSMFFPFDPADIRPKVRLSQINGREIEFYESDLTADGGGMLDFWRFSTNGCASTIRGYQEDRGPAKSTNGEELVPGTWLSPHMLARDVSEFVCHAVAMAELLDVSMIDFRFSWYGLANRTIKKFSWRDRHDIRTSVTETRTVRKTVERVPAKAEMHKVVADVINPVLRLFGGLEVDAQWVDNRIQEFGKM